MKDIKVWKLKTDFAESDLSLDELLILNNLDESMFFKSDERLFHNRLPRKAKEFTPSLN